MWRVPWPAAQEEMDVLGVYRQFHHRPVALGSDLLDQLPQARHDPTRKHRPAVLRAEHEVIGQEVNRMRRDLVVHTDSIQGQGYLLPYQREEGRFLPRLKPGVSTPPV